MTPEICPNCGSKDRAAFFYGMPRFTAELEQRLARREIVLGGCDFSEHAPAYKCNVCGTEYGEVGTFWKTGSKPASGQQDPTKK